MTYILYPISEETINICNEHNFDINDTYIYVDNEIILLCNGIDLIRLDKKTKTKKNILNFILKYDYYENMTIIKITF